MRMAITTVTHLTSVHDPFDDRIFHKECKTLAKAGYDVTLIAPAARDCRVDGVQIRAVPVPRNRFERILRTVPAVLREALKRRSDIYHFHDPELVGVGLVLKALRRRVVFDVHEDIPDDITTKEWIPARIRSAVALVADRLLRVLGRSFDGIVVAMEFLGERFPGAHLIVLRNFPDHDQLIGSANGNGHARSNRAIYLGSITRIRGVGEMVRAMETGALPADARLTLAGTFDDPDLEAEVRALPGWDRVDFVGWRSRGELAGYLGDAKVGLVVLGPIPTYKKILPTKLYEYMAAGIPVVASDFPMWRSFVESIGCGLVVDPEDPPAIARAVSALMTDPERAHAMGERGKLAVEKEFNWSSESERLLTLYRTLA